MFKNLPVSEENILLINDIINANENTVIGFESLASVTTNYFKEKIEIMKEFLNNLESKNLAKLLNPEDV